MALACVDADLTYHQGLDRKFSYRTRYDMFWPTLQGLGDQAILDKEIYYENNAARNDVFGYVPLHEELRTGINRLSGEFRSDNALSLDTWHVAQDWVGKPTLNDTFFRSQVPMGRVLQSTTNNHFIADFYIHMKAARPLGRYGIPGIGRL